MMSRQFFLSLTRFRSHALLFVLALCFLLTLPVKAQQSVSGTVTLQECQNSVQSLAFSFCATSRNDFFTRTATLASNGSYTLSDIPKGKYSLAIKGVKWLRAVVLNVDTTQGNHTGANATLLAAEALMTMWWM
jgi:hypothetical protein